MDLDILFVHGYAVAAVHQFEPQHLSDIQIMTNRHEKVQENSHTYVCSIQGRLKLP